MGNFRTSDGGTINLCMVSPTGLIRDTFAHFGIPEAGDDPRFADVHKLIENSKAASDLIVKAIGSKPFAYWRQHLKTMKGQWAPIQSLIDLASRRAGDRQRHDHRGRSVRWRRAAQARARPGAVQPRRRSKPRALRRRPNTPRPS